MGVIAGGDTVKTAPFPARSMPTVKTGASAIAAGMVGAGSEARGHSIMAS
jgi:hypothetical protein